MKSLVLKWQRLLDEQEKTCPRCGSTEQEVEKAAHSLKKVLAPLGIDVTLLKKAINPERFKKDVLQSNKIMIAGKTLEEWLGAKTGQSKCCETCGDAECRTVEYDEQTHEAIPADLIVRAGLVAAAQVFSVELPEAAQRKPILKIAMKRS
ncbi:MAG: DUF2703 domain-containing protein [Betaproteobacteria bacterium]